MIGEVVEPQIVLNSKMKQLTDMDKRISFSQAYNCATQVVSALIQRDSPHISQEDIKESVHYWQDWFYRELTTGYIQKFAPQEVKVEDKKKSEDVGLDDAINDLEIENE